MFGPWNVAAAKASFHKDQHVVIDDFFDQEVAQKIADEFPSGPEGWFVYHNPLEKKWARTEFEGTIKEAFEFLESDGALDVLRVVTGIDDLQKDPFRHGAGLHCHPRGGKLDMHVDYSVHPISGKTRALNLIVYMTPEWNPVWGGQLYLNGRRIDPAFNRAVVFRVDGLTEAVHGMPFPLTCPDGTYRRSMAVYYVRPGDPLHGNTRFKAHFQPMPGRQQVVASEHPRYGQLFEIRSRRRLEENDLWKGWEEDPLGKGLWYV